ncbi:Repressible high-affinity phosphate permease [Tolypocladium ophioglossoides CBS 100239]|uniref:Repressible high-affinity phosphate permease n=1 Tax=Tolypocladium ophioglossoides (strain CBS 100239) TaxID=1163406 RepID=A0A0L0MYZ6_TOLOC|nr:Repressible high-affinity phosphate permease [Tolypocladium ophioglossoides CBS 100239]
MEAPAGIDAKTELVTESSHLAARKRALAEVNARIGLPHIRAVVVAGSGFFTDTYDLFSANFITTMIGLAVYSSHSITTQVDTATKLSTTAGAVIGQVLQVGAKKMYGLELIIILVGTFGQSIAGRGLGLIFWRVVMGVGVGGYPLSSIITSEFATVNWRGALMNSVFAV